MNELVCVFDIMENKAYDINYNVCQHDSIGDELLFG